MSEEKKAIERSQQLPRHGWSSFAQGLSVLRKVSLGDLSFYGDEEHQEFLLSLGMRSARTMVRSPAGLTVDRGPDWSVVRLEGPSSVIYVKRFHEDGLPRLPRRLFLQRLHCLARIEVENILWLRERGFGTADLVFWGHSNWMGLDGPFSFVGLRELAGYRELRFDSRPEAMASSSMAFIRLIGEGFYWPDAEARRFLNSPDCRETVLIDLQHGRPRTALQAREVRRMVRSFLASFAPGDERHRASARRQLEELALGEIIDRRLRARLFKALQRV